MKPRQPQGTRRFATVATACLVVALSACGNDRSQGAQSLPTPPSVDVEPATVVRTPSNEVVAQIVTDRPLLATDNLEQAIDEVVQTEQLLVRRSYGECMVRQGFVDPDPPSAADVYRPQQMDKRYGALDVDGYSVALSEAINREVRSEPVSRDGTRTSDEYLKALNGSPSDYLSETLETPEGVFGFDLPSGCVGAAFEQIHGSREAKIELQKLVVLGQSLSNQSFAEMRRSGDVQIAIAAWSECMAKSGFEIADPWSIPVDDMTFAQRIETASADVLCKAESGVVDAAAAAETAWQSAHFAEIDKITVQLSSLLDRLYLSM